MNRKRSAVLTLVAMVFAGTMLLSPAGPVEPGAQSPRIEEDEPGWDCRTMGNFNCGPNYGSGEGHE